MTQETLIQLVSDCCKEANLSYNNNAPQQVSPGIWQFDAVMKSEECIKHGSCRQMRYYAMQTGNTLKLC